MPQQDDNLPADESRDGPLDELIRAALRTDVEPARLERLEQFWRDRSPLSRRRRRSRRIAALAAAASLLFAGWLILRGGANQDEQRADASREAPSPQEDAPAPSLADNAQPVESSSALSAGRPPTAYERLIFITQTRTRVPSPTPSPAEIVGQAVDRLTANPQEDVGRIPAELLAGAVGDFSRDEVEALLLEELPGAAGDRQVTLCRMLAVYGSERAVPGLLKLGHATTVGADALAAIEAIVGHDRWAEVARLAPDRPIRVAIAKRLLTAETKPALLAFLSLVSDETLRADALAAALDVPELPVDQLITLLDHEQESVRRAAAIALGKMNRCEMTTALIARVNTRPSRSKEAWFALLSCRCDAADQFLAYASQSPRLLGQLNNARNHWSRGMP